MGAANCARQQVNCRSMRRIAPAAPISQIGHMHTLATADDIMPYTPNNDTVYSGAFLELAGGPIILTAPDIADRYWSVEVADGYTDNLFYIGTRAIGGKGGNHAFVGPNWHGTLPQGVIVHRFPPTPACLPFASLSCHRTRPIAKKSTLYRQNPT
jgi:hypothetical protein